MLFLYTFLGGLLAGAAAVVYAQYKFNYNLTTWLQGLFGYVKKEL